MLTSQLLIAQQKKPQSYTQNIPGVNVAFGMKGIAGGQFAMGSPGTQSGRNADEGPVHQVELSPFWMSTHEVTWDIYELFVYEDYDQTKNLGIDAITRPSKPYLDMTFGMGKEGHPAVGMTHYNAIQFCKWLYSRTGIFYRLPTEAEWEYACKAGNLEAFHFGSDSSQLSNYAWLRTNSNEKTHPVGMKSPNAWGLYDMHGNVAEWTLDQYLPEYNTSGESKVLRDPFTKPEALYPHVIRGGSFEDNANALRSTARRGSDPDWKRIDPQIPKSNWWFPEAPFVGIRLVRPMLTPSKKEIEAFYNTTPIADL